MALGQATLGTTLNGVPGLLVIFEGAQGEDWNARSENEQLIEGGQALAVRQIEINHDRVDGLFAMAFQALQGLRQAGHPLNQERAVLGSIQNIFQGRGVVTVAGNDQNAISHDAYSSVNNITRCG